PPARTRPTRGADRRTTPPCRTRARTELRRWPARPPRRHNGECAGVGTRRIRVPGARSTRSCQRTPDRQHDATKVIALQPFWAYQRVPGPSIVTVTLLPRVPGWRNLAVRSLLRVDELDDALQVI